MSAANDKKSGWRASHGLNPSWSAEEQVRVNQLRQAQPSPIAEVTVVLYGTKKGQSEIRYKLPTDGPLAADSKHGAERAAAFQQVIALVEQELRRAFLGQA